MEFCHYYQIPFLDSNVPKSTKNAAKIYYKILQDGKKLSERFDNSVVIKYLASIPQEAIDEQFNPYNIKEKWTKFFRTGTQRATVDTERALKNEFSNTMKDFIRDKKQTFNDKQLIKAYYITLANKQANSMRERDNIGQMILNNVQAGKFEFKKGNTLAMFAEAFSASFDLNLKDSGDLKVPFDLITGKQ